MDDKYIPFNFKILNQNKEKKSDLGKPFRLKLDYIPGDDIPAVTQYVGALSFLSFVYGVPKLVFNQQVKPISVISFGIGTPQVRNFNKQAFVLGFNSNIFGTAKIYNLRQYIRLVGYNTNVFGTAYLQGGVKYIKPVGFNANIVPIPKAINTRANQYANPIAIVPPIITGPKISPRMLRPTGIKGDSFGQPFLQRNPSPKGFVNTTYGVTWISHSPRYLTPSIISAFESGYLKVFDPTQKIFFNGTSTIIVGGVFGDIGIRNTRRIINTLGILSQQFSDWATVESTRRSIESKSFNAQLFGNGFIHNKTPSIAPQGFISISGLTNIDIGYRIRTVKPSGFYLPKLGIHTLTKSPELNPKGINALVIGNAFISNRVRNVYVGIGRETLVFGETITWHYSRKFNPLGIKADIYGVPRIEHGSRTLLAQGSNQAVYGYNAWLSFAKRLVQLVSIPYPNMPIHRVGGTQSINPLGYIATLFGTRIIPENQVVYPQGFSNPFGLTTIDLWKKYLKPTGFLTTGQEGGHRFGTHHFWNLRKYIVQFYDVDSGLVPPKWTGWTGIANRNKVIGAIGNDASRVASPSINNNARPIYPLGINSLAINRPMIAERVRHLKLQGLEATHISGWHVVYNDAFVIAPRGINAQAFGVNQVTNNRRYFNRNGNFESLEIGKPMIADRIRKLSIEQRYSIAPPYIPIHRIDLYTRYIEEVGRFDDHQAFGSPSLTIHFNIIAPRWMLRDGYGSPIVKNLTPELGARGRNSEEFGDSLIRLQWRPLLQQSSEMVLWGKTEIAYRDRQFSVSGFTHWNIPRPKVIKTGVPPYYPQYIWLDAVEIDGEENKGHGIEIPKNQVSQPIVKSNVIFPQGFIATSFGSHHTQSNGILVQPGLQELSVGEPFVGLKNRMITVSTIGDSLFVSKPRLSPWTIYAVMEAPSQAQANHEPRGLHFVNSDSGTRLPGEVFGHVRIDLKHRKLNVGMGKQSQFNSGHKIDLRKRYINLTDFGFRSQRTGFHVVGPFDQHIVQFDAADGQGFGQTLLKIPHTGPYFIKPSGSPSIVMDRPVIDFFNRTVKASGRDHLQMGTRLNGDKPFMWQGLRIGELVSGNYGGFESEVFGKTFISLKVRDLILEGFETFAMEYDYTNFNDRMRVIRKEIPRPKIHINVIGFDATTYGVPNIQPATQYIRPDGNSDQFRKGAW
ncbi:hypothetical protein ACG94X_02460 [Acinetobacter sp. ULE_I010]|uniref:hypothetical protein n=1 Tax=Acinetobacter sp. ULE_I010 TaxID=3373065 RepID=UPI003AF48F8C